MLTEIGALIGIVKSLLDVVDKGSWLFGKGKAQTRDTLLKLQERLAGLADQLDRALTLSKMLLEWLIDENQFDAFENDPSDERIRVLDTELRSLIDKSIRDQFSGAFFRTKFDTLPGIEPAMAEFRNQLNAVDKVQTSIPYGDYARWRTGWPILKYQLFELRKCAVHLNSEVDQLLAAIVAELSKAASLKGK